MNITDTPILTQYREMKKKHPDAVLLFRVGDFYECFSEDAVTCSNVLGLTLSRCSNQKDIKSSYEFAGFPAHALDTYLPRLIRAGRRVAICEQLKPPVKKKNLIRFSGINLIADTIRLFLSAYQSVIDILAQWDEIKQHTQSLRILSRKLRVPTQKAFDEAFKELCQKELQQLEQPSLFEVSEPECDYSTIPQIKLSYVSDSKCRAKPSVNTSSDMARIIRDSYEEGDIELREYFKAVYLSRANKVLGIQVISMGGLSSTVVDPMLIYKGALLSNAASVILAHNHPSGNLKPSFHDDKITKEIEAGCKTLSLKLLDHVIVTADGYYSYRDEGKLN